MSFFLDSNQVVLMHSTINLEKIHEFPKLQILRLSKDSFIDGPKDLKALRMVKNLILEDSRINNII